MRQQILRRLADLALTAGAVIGVCCLLVTLASLIFDVRPLIFRSGSMAPAIPSGSLAIAHQVDATAVRTGEIVSVPYRDSRVTHRVVAAEPRGDGAVDLRLRGDANRSADPQPYTVRQVDRVLFSVPVLGSVMAWLSRPPGVFVLAGYAAILLTLILRRDGSARPPARHAADDDHDRLSEDPGPERLARGQSRRVQAALGVGLLGSTASLAVTPSWAAFTDPVDVTGTTISTGTSGSPTLNCGPLGALSVTFNWTAVPNATNYTLFYGANAGSQVTVAATSYTLTTAISGGQARVVANRNFGSTTWTSAPSNTRNYTVAVISFCS